MTDELLQTPFTTTNANVRTVQAFLFALADEDFDTVESLAAPELVWHNVGVPPIRGRARIMKLLRKGQGKFGFEVKFHNIAQDGGTVLTERTDAIIIGPLRLQFWVCGTFEVRDGEITLWRDYFDWAAVTGALLAGTGRALVSLLPGRR